MNALLTHLMNQLNSSVFILLAILFVVFWSIYKIGSWKERFLGYSNKMDKVDAMHDKMIELTTKVDLIYQNTNPRSLVASQSPLDLTDLGRKVADAIDATSLFESYRQGLLDSIEKRCPANSNAYDIQVAALDIAKREFPSLLSAGEINRIKEVAYAQGILIEDVWAIFGIFLRNTLLKERNIPVLEVDKHDPLRRT